MAINVTIVGCNDRKLEELLRGPDAFSVNSISPAELSSVAHPSARQPDVLLLDLRHELHLPPGIAPVKRQHPSTGVVIVADRLDPALMLEAMRAGVTECVTDVSSEELAAAIVRVAALRVAPTAGQVFAFIGAKGGVGTTTIAVNVATALAKAVPNETLFIDLHLADGDAALFLGVEPRFSVVDAIENTHRLDEAFFRGLLAQTKVGLHLLASSDRASLGPIDPARLSTLIEFASRCYAYVVLDVPRSDPAVLDALGCASCLIIVVNQELPTVRSASRLATRLRQRFGKEKVRVVMSRYDPTAEISPVDVERAVGVPVTFTFPSNYRVAIEALNAGRPMPVDNHNKLASSIATYARDLAGLKREEPPRPKPKHAAFFGLLAAGGPRRWERRP